MIWHHTDSITVDRLIATKEAKASIYHRQRFGAVNMEDYWIAELAGKAQIPFLSVRSVIDTASQELPGFVMLLDENPLAALVSACLRPWKLPGLLKLAGNLRVAQESLRRFAWAFLEQGDLVSENRVGGLAVGS